MNELLAATSLGTAYRFALSHNLASLNLPLSLGQPSRVAPRRLLLPAAQQQRGGSTDTDDSVPPYRRTAPLFGNQARCSFCAQPYH